MADTASHCYISIAKCAMAGSGIVEITLTTLRKIAALPKANFAIKAGDEAGVCCYAQVSIPAGPRCCKKEVPWEYQRSRLEGPHWNPGDPHRHRAAAKSSD